MIRRTLVDNAIWTVMKIPRTLFVFLGAAATILTLAILKALLVSGLGTLPPVKVLVFAATTFGLVAALLDWALLQGHRSPKPAATPMNEQSAPIIERARLRPIVFREICPPPQTASLSFYGGLPFGPPDLVWPRVRNKPGDAPLSFLMQWDCAELARQDATGLLPNDGGLYLFCDLTWGEPFDFQFVHASGSARDWRELPAPTGLPRVYGDEGAYQVPYCAPQIAKEDQDVPRLLPKWPFTSVAFPYTGDAEPGYWNDGPVVAEALLALQHPEGVPPPERLNKQARPFERPFAAFPHDYAAVRVVTAKVLDHLRRPESHLLREASEQEREAKFHAWRNQAAQHYTSAAAHSPAERVEPSLSNDIWHWMEGLEPLLALRWGSLIDECVNVSLGLGSHAANAIPQDLVATCAERHKLASAYLHEERRTVHASCPNHMFGPPSYVQGNVEEYLEEWLLLLELSTRDPIGLYLGEGVLQFLIRPADLREHSFDKAMLVASAY